MALSGDFVLDAQIKKWVEWDRNTKTKVEINQLIEKKDWKTLRDRLTMRLEFGTAGLRGCMRAGFDSMNDLVIIQTAQGLCKYILEQFPNDVDRKERGIVFGYDGRYNSKRFAELSSTIFIQNGVKVWLYTQMVPTPFVPAAIMEMKCLAGVMVTASHNPKEDNGYKVYWENGAQIIPPHDKNIQKAILNNLMPLDSSWNTNILENNPLLADPFEQIFKSYYDKMKIFLPEKLMESNKTCGLKCVYTAMHGVGYRFVEKAFVEANLLPVIAVEKQRDPDPEFPTVKFPNPEEGKSALDLSIQKANENNITLIIANDPDADRLACAEKQAKSGQWKIFSGNELGALLGWWSLQVYREMHPNVDNLKDCYLLASTVSSKILHSMSKTEGFQFEETLTGFKWMGNRSNELMKDGKSVLFAFEEAIGFMFSTNVLDKDGVSAACQLVTMASYLKQHGNLTLSEKLNEIYEKYGYHCSKNSYYICHDREVKSKIFDRLRHWRNGEAATYPEAVGDYHIVGHKDWSSQMITFTFKNGLVVTIRSSGTEPKIKYYSELCGQAGNADRQGLRQTLEKVVDIVVEEFLQPTVNGLQARAN